MSETVQYSQVGGCDVMDSQEESDGGKKIVHIDPEFVLWPDQCFLNVFEFVGKYLLEI